MKKLIMFLAVVMVFGSMVFADGIRPLGAGAQVCVEIPALGISATSYVLSPTTATVVTVEARANRLPNRSFIMNLSTSVAYVSPILYGASGGSLTPHIKVRANGFPLYQYSTSAGTTPQIFYLPTKGAYYITSGDNSAATDALNIRVFDCWQGIQ